MLLDSVGQIVVAPLPEFERKEQGGDLEDEVESKQAEAGKRSNTGPASASSLGLTPSLQCIFSSSSAIVDFAREHSTNLVKVGCLRCLKERNKEET
jgi:hypothetical protein